MSDPAVDPKSSRAAMELAWAAGLFEGEGSIFLHQRKSHSTLALGLNMTDEDSVRRFAKAVGVGNVTGPHETTHKPRWQWRCDGFGKAQAVIAMLWDGLGSRRKQRAKECLAATRVDKRIFGGDASRFQRGGVHASP